MHYSVRYLSFMLLAVLSSQCRSIQKNQETTSLLAGYDNVSCEIAIVGGGAAGLHTALRLAPKFGEKICLFEKEPRYGGRIYDESFDPISNSGPYIAVGARRVQSEQVVVMKLAKELGIELQKTEKDAELIFSRRIHASNKDDFLKAYPGLQVEALKGDFETQLLEKLLKSPERARIDRYKDFKSYAVAIIGQESYQYLRDMSRFRADFEYPLSAKSYMEYLDEEFNLCCESYFPVGGMSAFIRAMERKSEELGVRFYLEEPVKSINKESQAYRLTTSRRQVIAQQVVIAVPPQALEKITGGIVEAIRAQDQFKSLIGVKVTTIAQWYPEPWWKNLKLLSTNQEVWRAWTTAHCLNSIEIPQENYAAAQVVMRSVYNDQKECVEQWAAWAKESPDTIEREIAKGLEQLFANNGVSTPVKIGKPTKTFYWEWPDAWYWIRAGYSYSNQDIFDWAVEPLPGEKVGLASEGYNPQRSGWSDGAFKSSINLLNRQYGQNLPIK